MVPGRALGRPGGAAACPACLAWEGARGGLAVDRRDRPAQCPGGGGLPGGVRSGYFGGAYCYRVKGNFPFLLLWALPSAAVSLFPDFQKEKVVNRTILGALSALTLVATAAPAGAAPVVSGELRGQTISGYTAVQRTYGDLPVVGADAVQDAAGRTVSRSEAFDVPLRLSTVPTTRVAGARLVVEAYDNRPKLAWERVDGSRHTFLDAHTGRVTFEFDLSADANGKGYYYGDVDLPTTQSGANWTLVDSAHPGGQCGPQTGQPYSKNVNSFGTGVARDLETACVDALYSAGKENDMLKAWFGREGLDGKGRSAPQRVGMATANAMWNGSYANYGYNMPKTKDLTAFDIAGHELGHGVFQWSGSSVGGYRYFAESGALNESTGDIMGTLTEHYANDPHDKPDYDFSEMADFFGNGKPMRILYKPSNDGRSPDCYSSSIPSTEIHLAGGVQNHWFYLLAEGTNPTNGQPVSPTCNNSTLSGIGIQTAGKIFHAALQLKTSSWNFANARKATLQVAKASYPANCAAVKAAWDAVSVAAAPGEVTC
ncbi:M4 family peptidase [Pseudonocardiaceae bacterium YIM PH 21723]|nr:M4 family peptidase [Pseudonocardiaceae bacterium YIM PH 21723]